MSERGEAALRFNILGPLEAWSGTTRLRLGGAIQERVLTTLLLEPGRVVPVGRLVQAAWDDDPPATAPHQIRKAVADLRRRLPRGDQVIVTDGPGYRAVPAEGELDLTEFAGHLRDAGRAASAGSPREAVEELSRALALWRGPVMADTGSAVIQAAGTTLDERRLAAAEQLFELRLGLGEAAGLIGDLRDLIAQKPLRETLRGHLMLALYRTGRQAEALEEYQKVRELLLEELGVDPGPRLGELHAAILREAPELAAPGLRLPSAPAAPGAPAPGRAEPPCTLPYDLSDFTGRKQELDALVDCIKGGGEQGGRHSRIVAIDGMGGSGKTTLAVRAAHQVAADFPDGQLHLDLRGFTPGESPVSPATALDALLRAVGTPGDRIPDDLQGRTALWRSTLAQRRLLLLVDNALDVGQVLPLLPASHGCLVLVTSRARLVDLDGAEWFSIGPMSHEDSMLLIEEVLGAARVVAEPAATAELVRLCGRLPLALRIVAARLRNRPRWTVEYLVDRLRDETRRLEELSAGERSVAASLRLSYQIMDEEHRVAFRILGLRPGADIDVYAAAALLGTGRRDAELVLERLLDVHLLQQPAIGLYRFHDLVHNFAQSQCGPDSAQDDIEAVLRLLDYYLTTTETACELLFSGRRRRSTGIPAYRGDQPVFTDAADADGWFGREHANLVAAISLAHRRGLDRHTVCLTRNVVFRLNARGQFKEFRDVGRIAVEAARRLGDVALLGVSLSNLGVACWKLGHFDEGLVVATEARDVAVRLRDQHTEAHGESTIGLLLTVLGRHPEALVHLERAITLERELDIPRAEAETLTNLSTLYAQWGRCEEAATAARQALELHRGFDYRDNHVMALTDLAFAHIGLGQYEDAHQRLEQARALCDSSSPPGDVALALALSAWVAECMGRPAPAAGFARRALELARVSGSPTRQAKVENLIGEFCRRRGEYEKALSLHAHAHELATAISYRAEQARALNGMADAAETLGDTALALEYRAAAAELFDAMGCPVPLVEDRLRA
ncbi:BTAD domain-containing putative transcriptional regulator [Streptomyces sp. TLI_185]|uniref:AfsR/SARP family transcriptional regulator n=1 Tax=Streptomyces sp. TLI_185 TaxID=2485151 RepID=UPI000F4E0BE4|nr:BTAD domain-containing putative transcriptional regulator [Streptomyces sp. TLI_185]RPF35119.1 DNA-binding SARP family transcriptional activator [Streptomyces sp. TLI_185]